MNGIYTQFAAESNSNLFSALGIDWKMLIFQIIGFLLLVWVMGKFIYPILLRTLDERQAGIEAGAKAAAAAEEKAEKAAADIDKLTAKARKDAADIVATAHDEAAAAIEKAQAKAKTDAEHIVANAHDQLEKDVIAARQALRNDTLDLVATATEKIAGKHVAKTISAKELASAVEESK